ncbi:MAG: tetratricopeptide repeat protein [Chloroflexi bacterium]|nr:tetratricopeptide repeat protein [Chloroflexota bacterium]
MREERTPGSIPTIIKSVTDIASSVGAVTAYLVAIIGIGDIPYQKTTSLLTILATSILVINWRWAKLRSKKKESQGGAAQKGRGAKTPPTRSLLERLLDPIRTTSSENYTQPLILRRIDAGVILSLTLFTLGWTGVNITGVIRELSTNPSLTCNDSRSKDELRIVIADLQEPTAEPQLLISDSIYDSLVNYEAGDFYTVCRLFEPVKVVTIATEIAETHDADIVIWGRSDAVIYKIHLEAPALGDPHRNLSELGISEATSVEFQLKEPEHISFVSQFALTELLLLNGQVAEAQARLADALDEAVREELNPLDIAEGYYLLGLFYDPHFSTVPDEEKSIESYSKAIDKNPNLYEAWLNRGFLQMILGRNDEAITDFNYLIENNTPYKGSAYVNRASLQSDPDAVMRDLDAAVEFAPEEGYFFRGIEWMNRGEFQNAIDDLEKAIEIDPEGYENYHYLGLVQLYAGEYEAAKKTYALIIPYLDEDILDEVIVDLQDSAEVFPEIKPTTDEIIQALQVAELP